MLIMLLSIKKGKWCFIMTNELLKKTENFIKDEDTAVLSSIDENGYPRTAAMSSIKTEGIKTIWFSTGTNSHKAKNLKRNCKASVCYYATGSNITLIGEVAIVEDMDIKKQLWVDWFIEHFPLGVTDPNYCILKFETKYIQVWLEGNFEEFYLD